MDTIIKEQKDTTTISVIVGSTRQGRFSERPASSSARPFSTTRRDVFRLISEAAQQIDQNPHAKVVIVLLSNSPVVALSSKEISAALHRRELRLP